MTRAARWWRYRRSSSARSPSRKCAATKPFPTAPPGGDSARSYKAQEVAAREAHKQRIRLTVRVENTISIRAQLKAGFRITEYDPTRYGLMKHGGARLIMEKDLINETFPFHPHKQAALVAKKCGSSKPRRRRRNISCRKICLRGSALLSIMTTVPMRHPITSSTELCPSIISAPGCCSRRNTGASGQPETAGILSQGFSPRADRLTLPVG